jgi:probable rRNA maturation factor
MTLAARNKPKRRPSRRRPTPPIVDIVVTSALWKGQRNAKTVLRRSIAAAACAVSTTEGELAIVLTDDSAIRALNRDWRRKDAATNVLSFPANEPVKKPPKKVTSKAINKATKTATGNAAKRPAREPAPGARGTPRLLGDIVIAYETTEREARAEHKPFAHHLAHLAVHGFLHLVGYDHARDDEANAMEGLETAILAGLDVPNPYVARGAGD